MKKKTKTEINKIFKIEKSKNMNSNYYKNIFEITKEFLNHYSQESLKIYLKNLNKNGVNIKDFV